MNKTIYILTQDRYKEVVVPSSSLLLALFSKVPGASYDVKTGKWKVPLYSSLFLSELCEYAKKKHLVNKVVYVEDNSQINYFAENMDDLQYPLHLHITPYDYQRKGIQYMVSHKRTFNCDDMGLGKTMQSIAAVSVARAYPCLVVCPASMKVTWQREFKKFSGKEATILDNENKDNWHNMFITGICNVFIVNYESIAKFFVLGHKGLRLTVNNIEISPIAKMFRCVIIDECHRCKESSTKWSRYLEAICKGKEYIFMLTGTPIVTGNKDLIQQLKIMGRINDFGGVSSFKARYCGNVDSVFLSELNFKLWQTCYFRRDKSLVLKELPEKIRQYNIVELTNDCKYRLAEDNLIEYIHKYEHTDNEKLQRIYRGKAIVQIGVLRKLSAEGKLSEAYKTIGDILNSGEKLIVFASHKEIVSAITKKFKGCVTVTGSDTPEQKQKSIDKFQKEASCKLIVVNIKSGGTGITLTAASNVLFVEFPWTAADCDQCECRSHRNGQKKVVNCIYLLGKNTFDETMYNTIQKEREIAGVVTGATDDVTEKVFDTALKRYTSHTF